MHRPCATKFSKVFTPAPVISFQSWIQTLAWLIDNAGATPDVIILNCQYRATTLGPAGETQNWKKTNAPGYPEDSDWQSAKCDSFFMFLVSLSLSCVFCCFLTWYWPLVLIAHERPRNEYNRQVEPRTFATYQLPLKPPYVSLCLTFLDGLRFFKSNFAACRCNWASAYVLSSSWYKPVHRMLTSMSSSSWCSVFPCDWYKFFRGPFDFPYGLLTLSCRYSARAYCSRSLGLNAIQIFWKEQSTGVGLNLQPVWLARYLKNGRGLFLLQERLAPRKWNLVSIPMPLRGFFSWIWIAVLHALVCAYQIAKVLR